MEQALLLTFGGLAVVFSIWIAKILAGYAKYRRLAPSSMLSWTPPRPWYFKLCLGIGFFMVGMTTLSALVLNRPVLVVAAQGLMAVFYSVVFPLAFRIQRGFYASGIWTERGFVPYSNIQWLGWKESPQIVLALRMDGRFFGQKYTFLRVPGSHYGQARRILADQVAQRSLAPETSVLGLESPTSPQDRV